MGTRHMLTSKLRPTHILSANNNNQSLPDKRVARLITQLAAVRPFSQILTVFRALLAAPEQASRQLQTWPEEQPNTNTNTHSAMEHNWVARSVYDPMPPMAITAGHDSDNDPIYVGRAYHNGDMLPAKVVPNKQQAYVAWGGAEISKHDFEVLTGEHYCWIPASGGEVPPHALRVGQTADGEQLFVGRGYFQGSLTPGKVQPSHGCLYIPYGGAEHKLEGYEVLVQPETWVNSSGSHIVPGTILAGHDADGDPIYVGRAYHDGDLLPAKVIPSKGCAYVSHGGREHVKHDFELLAGYGYGWVPDSYGNVPSGAVVCGRTAEGEPLFIGRGHYGGSFTPGKIHQSHSCLYIPFGGQEVRLDNYEVLVRN